MKSCPCCGKTPNRVVTRTMRAEDNRQGIMIDALICPACQAIIGVTIGADGVTRAQNAWDAAVATYPQNHPHVWNKAAVPSPGEKPSDHEYVKVEEPVQIILEGIGQRVERLSVDLEIIKARVGRTMEENQAIVWRRYPIARAAAAAPIRRAPRSCGTCGTRRLTATWPKDARRKHWLGRRRRADYDEYTAPPASA